MSGAAPSKWADLGVRTGSALVLVPAVLWIVWAGGIWFAAFAFLLGVLMAREWVTISFGRGSWQFLVHALAATAFFVGPPVIAVMCLSVLTVVSFLLSRSLQFWKLAGVAYVGLPVMALVLLRSDAEFGLLAVVWCMVMVWSADVMAYFFGRIIGGPKMAPRISPKKTWAGMVGAVVGAMAASFAVSYFAKLSFFPLAGLAAVFAVMEQGGDIFESAFKRHYDVKDSGTLIPGHGGVLDRIDGLIAVVVAAVIVGFLHNPASPAAGLLHW